MKPSQNSILFSVCPHDTAKGLKFWNKFKKDLEDKLGEYVEFEPFYSFEEEKEKLSLRTYHLYYAGFNATTELYRRNYKPIAKIKGQKDEFYIIGKDESIFEKTNVKLALLSDIPIGYGSVIFDFEYVDVIYAKNFEEILKLLLEDKADLGLMYNETWEQIEDRYKKGIKILKNTGYITSHVFMAHPSVYEKLKPILLSFDFLEEAKEEDIVKFLRAKEKAKIASKRMEEHDLAKALLNSKNIGILIYQDKIVFANKYAKDLVEYKEEEICNMHPLDILYEQKDICEKIVKKILKRRKFDKSFSEIKVLTKTKRALTLNTFTSATVFKGKPSGCTVFFDITKQKRLENMYMMLKEVNQAITLSTFEEELFSRIGEALVDKFKFKLVWVGESEKNSDYFKVLYKFGEDIGYLDKVRISYKENAKEGVAFKDSEILIVSDMMKESTFAIWRDIVREYRFMSMASIPINVNNKPKFVISMYSEEPKFFDEDIVSILEEIKTDIEFALKKLDETKESVIIKKAIESTPSWMIIVDDNFNIVYANDAVSEISGYKKEELIGNSLKMFMCKIAEEKLCKVLDTYFTENKPFQGIITAKKKDGEPFYLDSSIYPIEIAPGLKKYMYIGKDITKEKKLSSEISRFKELSEVDALTKTYNRRFFDEILDIFINNYRDKTAYFSIIMLDIDDFKKINDTYGHDVGDAALKKVSEIVLKNIRQEDIFCRIGGEEFVLIVKLNAFEAFSVAEKLRKLIENTPISYNDINIKVTCSLGVAEFDRNDTKESLFKKADLALYTSKNSGKNMSYLFFGSSNEI